MQTSKEKHGQVSLLQKGVGWRLGVLGFRFRVQDQNGLRSIDTQTAPQTIDYGEFRVQAGSNSNL